MKERPNPNLELSSLASPISANTLYFYSTVSKFTGTHSRLLHGGEIPLHLPLSRAFRRPPVRPLAAGKGVAMTSLSSRPLEQMEASASLWSSGGPDGDLGMQRWIAPRRLSYSLYSTSRTNFSAVPSSSIFSLLLSSFSFNANYTSVQKVQTSLIFFLTNSFRTTVH